MIFKTICPLCKKMQMICVLNKDYEEWKNGKLIQKAFPYLTDSEREAILTGYCSKCWDVIAKE